MSWLLRWFSKIDDALDLHQPPSGDTDCDECYPTFVRFQMPEPVVYFEVDLFRPWQSEAHRYEYQHARDMETHIIKGEN